MITSPNHEPGPSAATPEFFVSRRSNWKNKKMLRITMSVSPEAAAKYFDSALEKADYYAKSETTGKGFWSGQGAGRLGLGGEVKRDDFICLASNDNPQG